MTCEYCGRMTTEAVNRPAEVEQIAGVISPLLTCPTISTTERTAASYLLDYLASLERKCASLKAEKDGMFEDFVKMTKLEDAGCKRIAELQEQLEASEKKNRELEAALRIGECPNGNRFTRMHLPSDDGSKCLACGAALGDSR